MPGKKLSAADWPSSGFAGLTEARDWVESFVVWYNENHKHSKINFVTPTQCHAGQNGGILLNRKKVITAAKKAKPYRWPGDIRNCEPVGSVTLNPDDIQSESDQAA